MKVSIILQHCTPSFSTHACVETGVHGLCVAYVERPPFGDVGVDASGSLVSLTVHLRYLLVTLGPLDVVPEIKKPYLTKD